MICQRCQQRPASVHVTQIINNEKREVHLCEQCAHEDEQIAFSNPFSFVSPFNISNFLTGFLGKDLAYQVKHKEPTVMPVCSNCGMTYEQFTRSGKMGCANCYLAFSNTLESVLKRVHGTTYHNGKLPQRTGGKIKSKREMDSLKSKLIKAVQNEEYEQAADLRDQIRELELQLKEEE
ncbi:MAG: UvrB/UvrC motif-containing protein [Clostridia bacterium]